MIFLTDKTINTDKLIATVQSHACGAVVLFLGTTREFTNGRQTESLDYQAYDEMALTKLQQLADQAKTKWPLENVSIVHRLGHLELGEASVAVAVASPHRKHAFEAAQWIMDQIKLVVPIWKKENWADGTSQWVHPGLVQQ